MCEPQDQLPVCAKPMAEGACAGNFSRWFYNRETGQCENFMYSGCRGNNNRYVSS